MHNSGAFALRDREGLFSSSLPSAQLRTGAGTHSHKCFLEQKLSATVPNREAAEYGFLLSQERRRTVRREIAEVCVCNYHRRHSADCNGIGGLHPSPICGEGGPAKAGRVGVCPHSASSDRPLRCGRPSPLKGEGQEERPLPASEKLRVGNLVAAHPSRRALCALLRMRS